MSVRKGPLQIPYEKGLKNNILVCHLSIHAIHNWIEPFVDKRKANVFYVNPSITEETNPELRHSENEVIFNEEYDNLTTNDILHRFESKETIQVFAKKKLLGKIDKIVTVYCDYPVFIVEDKQIDGKYKIIDGFLENVYELLRIGGKLYFHPLNTFYNYLCGKPVYAMTDEEKHEYTINEDDLQYNGIFRMNNSNYYYFNRFESDVFRLVDLFNKKAYFLNYYKADPSYDDFNVKVITDKILEPYLDRFKIIQYPSFDAPHMDEEPGNLDAMLILEKR